MAQELPDDEEQLKEYVEYLLDQNQFLDKEYTEAEKEKIEIKNNSNILISETVNLYDLDRREGLNKVADILIEIDEKNRNNKSEWSNEKLLFMYSSFLIKLKHIKEYLQDVHPEHWNRHEEDYQETVAGIKSEMRNRLSY